MNRIKGTFTDDFRKGVNQGTYPAGYVSLRGQHVRV